VNVPHSVETGVAPEGRIFSPVGIAVWVLSTIVGALAFFYLPILILLPVAMMTEYNWLMVLFLALGGAVSGAIVGYIVGRIQITVLSDRIAWSSGWVRATVVGWATYGAAVLSLAIVLGELLKHEPSVTYSIVWIVGFGGVGLSQWLLLRRYLNKAKWWFAATILGWVTGITIVGLLLSWVLNVAIEQIVGESVSAVFSSSSSSDFLGFWFPPLFWTLVGSFAGVATWFVLSYLLSQERPQQEVS
jgi:hypothetical protein